MSDEDQKPELTLEIAFNNLVGVAREMKLNNNEHTLLERSVQKVLEELPEDYRDVLVMVYGEGMSLRQVESFTGIPKTTVARRRDAVAGMFAKLLLIEMPELAERYEISKVL